MVSKQGKDETLDTGVDETQTETAAATVVVVDAAVEKLLHQV